MTKRWSLRTLVLIREEQMLVHTWVAVAADFELLHVWCQLPPLQSENDSLGMIFGSIQASSESFDASFSFISPVCVCYDENGESRAQAGTLRMDAILIGSNQKKSRDNKSVHYEKTESIATEQALQKRLYSPRMLDWLHILERSSVFRNV